MSDEADRRERERTFVNAERTLVVWIAQAGVTVATRERPADSWSPPFPLAEEKP